MKTCLFKDQIACNVLKFGWSEYEHPMGKIVCGLSTSLPIAFVDIGANTGFYSLLASTSGAKKVIAYEPVPGIFEILKINTVASNLDILLCQEAVADQPGHMTMYLPKTDNKYIETSASLNADFRDEHADTVNIQVRSLDELCLEYQQSYLHNELVYFLKIDVESYELPVLKGGTKFFEKIQPIIMIELLKDNCDRQVIYDLICAYGYVAFSLSRHSIKKLNELDTQSASDNYLFVPITKLSLICDTLRSTTNLTIEN